MNLAVEPPCKFANGCFSLVLECVFSGAARRVTDLLKIPTIGIGAGASVNGQVIVYQDVLGLNPGFEPKFLRTYANTFGCDPGRAQCL
jgi:3-methyl-2-oxobutanoate hydroxymethyltransferase